MELRMTILDSSVNWETRAGLRALCEAALWRFRGRIRYVEAKLRGVHRGGVDKVCGLRIVTRDGVCVHAADCGRSLEEALDRATSSMIARVLRSKDAIDPTPDRVIEQHEGAA